MLFNGASRQLIPNVCVHALLDLSSLSPGVHGTSAAAPGPAHFMRTRTTVIELFANLG
jgi:hypothetical protein